jgi:colanic acid/amylovoran biosynthesis glycosyltransferase
MATKEGQPVSIAEAAACALPIVSTRHDGIPDVVLEGSTGYLVEEGDTHRMGERIAYLATNPGIWTDMGRRARRHVEAHMNMSVRAGKGVTLYRRYARQE